MARRTLLLLATLCALFPPARLEPHPARAEASRNIRGIHTLARDDPAEIDTHLTWAALLVGPGGFVTQPFAGLGRDTPGPSLSAAYFVEQAYARGLTPIVRLQGTFRNQTGCDPVPAQGWEKPKPDDPLASPPSYHAEAEGYRRFVAGLPRLDGQPLYVQVGNEPNLHYMWSGAANPTEYAHFLVHVAAAIRSLGDDRIRVLNAGLAPEGDHDNLDFLHAALAAEPAFTTAFDAWATHAYPRNQPPDRNLHDGTALPGSRYTVDAYLLELAVLRSAGLDTSLLEVFITETGYALGDLHYPHYPPISEENRADYLRRAFADHWPRWPEVRAVTPFQLADPHESWQPFDWVWPRSASDLHGHPTQPHLHYARQLAGVGLVRGTAVGSTGNLLKAVSISTTPNAHQAATLPDGTFILIAHPGAYTVTAAKPGHAPAHTPIVQVTAGSTTDLRLVLPEQLPTTLQNPSFETDDLAPWTTWGSVDGPQTAPWYFDLAPRHGARFLGAAVNCGEKDGGLYQTLAVHPTSTLTLTAQALTFRIGDAPIAARLGLDPHGGIDPASPRITWSPWTDTANTWQQLALTTPAQTDRATIFLEFDQHVANPWNIVGFDDVQLVQHQAQSLESSPE